jgi:hypothetical protein
MVLAKKGLGKTLDCACEAQIGGFKGHRVSLFVTEPDVYRDCQCFSGKKKSDYHTVFVGDIVG